MRATIRETGNGFPDAGAYVSGDGELFRVVQVHTPIHTAKRSGDANYVFADVDRADWDDCEEADVFSASVEVQSAPLIYYPTYALRVDLSEGDASWLADEQGQGPLALEDVTDVCATLRVSAELRDAAGFLVGRVDPDGNYRLGQS